MTTIINIPVISITVHSMLFLNYMQFDTSIIIIVSKYQEKKMTATDFVMVFVKIHAYMCLLLPISA